MINSLPLNVRIVLITIRNVTIGIGLGVIFMIITTLGVMLMSSIGYMVEGLIAIFHKREERL